MLPVWPAKLPKLLAEGYGYSPQDAFVRTDMDSGLARTRRRFLTVPSQVTVSWAMSASQLALYEAFVKYDLLGGGAWFQLDVITATGPKPLKVRFTEVPKVAVVSTRQLWSVTGTIETLDMPVMSEADYRALL